MAKVKEWVATVVMVLILWFVLSLLVALVRVTWRVFRHQPINGTFKRVFWDTFLSVLNPLEWLF